MSYKKNLNTQEADIRKMAIVFPGQGSQFVGMGKNLYDTYEEARYVFESVDEVLKKNLSAIIFNGSEEELKLTINAQPAIFAVSIAILYVILGQVKLRDISTFCTVVAGHSLGEYTALCAAQVFTLEDTTMLLENRARMMHEMHHNSKHSRLSSNVSFNMQLNTQSNDMSFTSSGAMVALLGSTIDVANRIIAEAVQYGVCEIANDNGNGQIVLSGDALAIEHALSIAQSSGAKRAAKLPVSGAFHSSLMLPAATGMRDVLAKIVPSNPIVPVIANYTAKSYKDSAEEVRTLLEKQICNTVRWAETIDYMVNNFYINTIVEIGPGNVLSNLIKRTKFDREINVLRVYEAVEIESFVQFLQTMFNI